MKIYLLNDRTKPMHVYIDNLYPESNVSTIPAASGDWVEVAIPKDKELFIKIWETGVTLVSYVDPEITEYVLSK